MLIVNILVWLPSYDVHFAVSSVTLARCGFRMGGCIFSVLFYFFWSFFFLLLGGFPSKARKEGRNAGREKGRKEG